MAGFFGWAFKRVEDEKPTNNVSFAPEQKDDGAIQVAAGGSYGTYIDLEGTVRTEAELVTKYRDLALQPEIDDAIDDIVNESVVVDEDEYIVKLNTDHLKNVPEKVKKRLQAEFDEILDLLDFNNNAYEIFRRWYVDGRLYYHAIIDPKTPSNGLIELRYVDPRKIRKVREVKQVRDPNGVMLKKTTDEYFAYYERGYLGVQQSNQSNWSGDVAVKIALDTVVHVTSGLMDQNNTMVLSYLHKALKVYNQLRALEDSTVIYRLARAPERRIFYIDVGNMPKAKAEQYLQEMMRKHKNRLVYDASTGEMRDDRKYMTMLEDYWFPRREGGKGTEISTLPAGQNLGELSDINYFEKKLMKALKVPSSRLNPEGTFNFGKSSEITRDEVKFSKFVGRLRRRFNQLFVKALEKNVVLKGIMTQAEWQTISRKLMFDYQEDNHFAELKDIEILNNRLQTAQAAMPFVNKYFSNKWVRTEILKQDEVEIEQLDSEIEDEEGNPQYANMNPTDQMMGNTGDMLNDPMGGGGFGPGPGEAGPSSPDGQPESSKYVQDPQEVQR